MSKQFFSQSDPEWQSILRHHGPTATALEAIDSAMLAISRKNRRDQGLVEDLFDGLGKLGKALHEFVGGRRGSTSTEYNVDDYGCWDCCIAMAIARLGCRVYPFIEDQGRESQRGVDADPSTVLSALHRWQIVGISGFAYDLYMDPASIITKSQVQLIAHADYGVDGAWLNDASLLQRAVDGGDDVVVVACVSGHPAFGGKSNSHWIIAEARKTPGDRLMMSDPSEDKGPTNFSYRKVYKVVVYGRGAATAMQF
jgi:hypothetical protein